MTTPHETQPFAQLMQRIAPRSTLLRTWPLSGGMSAEMTALELIHPGGETRKLILRQPNPAALQRNPQAAGIEFRLLQATQRAGLATPVSLYLDETAALFPTPYLVIEYIEGQPDFAPTDLAASTRQLADHLARIHGVDGSQTDLSFLPKRAWGWAATFGRHPITADPFFAEARIGATLAAVWPLAQQNRSALLHGDFWPGNLLWRDDILVAIVDWEDAHLGDPLVDLAISRLDVLCIFGVEALRRFTQHYQAQMELDYRHLPYWDLYAALRLVRLAGANFAEWAAFYPPFGRRDITEGTLRAHYQWFISQAFAKLPS